MNLSTLSQSVGSSIASDVIASLIAIAITAIIARLSSVPILARFSLRTRITTAVLTISALGVIAMQIGANPVVCLIVVAIASTVMIQRFLSDLSQVGILNAFASTARGVSAEASLKRIRSNMLFLGVGAKKLTDSPEFEAALRRCKAAGGNAHFLLSDPKNPALEVLAKGNQKDIQAYRLRVWESILEIFMKGEMTGVNFEVRLYKLEHELSLPHFRLMFIDNSHCLFSYMIFNEQEGLDNPQLVLRGNTPRRPNTLYRSFRCYFDDLWNSSESIILTKEMLGTLGP